jgi:hypothetical protein
MSIFKKIMVLVCFVALLGIGMVGCGQDEPQQTGPVVDETDDRTGTDDTMREPETGPTGDQLTDPTRDQPTTDPMREPTTDPMREPTTDPMREPTTDPTGTDRYDEEKTFDETYDEDQQQQDTTR